MFDFLALSLQILPVLGLFVFLVAVAGHRFGNGGAISATLLLLLCASVSQIWLGPPPFGVRANVVYVLTINGLAALAVVGPMLILSKEEWLWRRFVVGLLGALVAAVAAPVVGLFAACAILGDCL